MLNDLLTDEFQFTVSELLIRNKSILDITSKLQEASASIVRAVAKSSTQCGCVIVETTPAPKGYGERSTHLNGQLCEDCRETIAKEIGESLFYLASLCNVLDFNLYDIILEELERVRLLGRYSLR